VKLPVWVFAMLRQLAVLHKVNVGSAALEEESNRGSGLPASPATPVVAVAAKLRLTVGVPGDVELAV
jgi:hypothetical protein